MENQLVDLINKISNYLITLAPEVYKIYKLHTIYEGITMLILGVITVIAGCITVKYLKDILFNSEYKLIKLLIFVGLSIIYIPLIVVGIEKLINPNYYIIQEFIEMIK